MADDPIIRSDLDEQRIEILRSAAESQAKYERIIKLLSVFAIIALVVFVGVGIAALRSFSKTQTLLKVESATILALNERIDEQTTLNAQIACLIERQTLQQNRQFRAFAKRFGVKIEPPPKGSVSVQCAVHTAAVTAAPHGPRCSITGTDEPDILFGTEGPDVICAGGGIDYVDGKGGHDILLLGDGADFGTGGPGPDEIVGGEGDDVAAGEGGHDVLLGDEGNDVLDAIDGKNSDKVDGGDGTDQCAFDLHDHAVNCEGDAPPAARTTAVLAAVPDCTRRGTAGNNTIVGGNGRDVLCGLGGNDNLYGKGGPDALRGAGENDYERGGPGPDVLFGDFGRDVQVGDDQPDELNGGPGRDRLFAIDDHSGDILDGRGGVDYCFGDHGDSFLHCEHRFISKGT